MQESLREDLWGELQVKATGRAGKSVWHTKNETSEESVAWEPGQQPQVLYSWAAARPLDVAHWLERERTCGPSLDRQLFLNTMYTECKATGPVEQRAVTAGCDSLLYRETTRGSVYAILLLSFLLAPREAMTYSGTPQYCSPPPELPTSFCQVGVGPFPHLLKN